MTGSDLIVVAPWVIFGLCVAVMYVHMRRARRSARRPSSTRRKQGD